MIIRNCRLNHVFIETGVLRVQTLEDQIVQTATLLERMPTGQVLRMETQLRDLTPEQRDYARCILNLLRHRETHPAHEIHLLEHFFGRWSTQSLATKLVLVSNIMDMASSLSGHEGPELLPNVGPFERPPALAEAR